MNETKKGFYEKAEVDKFITDLVKEYEENLLAQKERIFLQVEDIDRLKSELMSYKKREKFISQAIVSALQKADQIEALARQKYEAELSKLQNFYNKFEHYYNNIVAFYPPDEELGKIGQFLDSMEGILEQKSREFAEVENKELSPDDARTVEAYEQERARLQKNGWQIKPIEEQINNMSVKSEQLFKKHISGAEEIAANLLVGLDIKTPIGKIKKHLDNQIPREPAQGVIDLEEVLRPTKSLEDLCAELGLLTDEPKKKR